ncbi:MAG: hypothetical protein Q9174_002011 [Haloplaca sp. 1 TL-2023]
MRDMDLTAGNRRLQKRGRDQYKRKDYKAALSSFNSALSRVETTSIDILNDRAATHEKLGDLHAALKDGRRMISMNEGSCAAYRRTGKILQLMREDKKAVRIYEMGLRNVSPNDPDFKLLSESQEAILRVTRDPLTILPTEIALMIVRYLRFDQLVSLTRVSKTWRAFLLSAPTLWKSLDFSKAKSKLPYGALQRYIRCSKRQVTALVMNRRMSNWDATLNRVVGDCPELMHLQIDSIGSMDDLLSSTRHARNLQHLVLSKGIGIPLYFVYSILKSSPTLVSVEFHQVTQTLSGMPWCGNVLKLRALVINCSGAEFAPKPNIGPLLWSLGGVRKLSLAYCDVGTRLSTQDGARMPHLEELRLSYCEGEPFFSGLPSLRILHLISCAEIVRLYTTWTELPDFSACSLVELSLANSYLLEPEDLIRLVSRTQELQYLNLSQCCCITASGLKSLLNIGALDKAVELDVSGTVLTDRVVEQSIRNLKQLKRINIGNCASITGISIKALMTKAGCKLEYLDIDGCRNVSADAIALARNIPGLTVRYGISDSKGGKKIRYG